MPDFEDSLLNAVRAFRDLDIEMNDMGFWDLIISRDPDMAAKFQKYFDVLSGYIKELEAHING